MAVSLANIARSLGPTQVTMMRESSLPNAPRFKTVLVYTRSEMTMPPRANMAMMTPSTKGVMSSEAPMMLVEYYLFRCS